MCTFVEQPLTFNTDISEKSINYEIYLKPTPEKEYYRFRLLWFNDDTDRKTPFIERFIHSVWIEEGEKRSTRDIVCPTSLYVKKTWAGDAYDDCPICRFGNNNYLVAKESNYKDTIAHEKAKKFKRRFQAVIPVYVISDPVYDANNGKFKAFIITDKAIFDKFKALVIERNANNKLFNGENALDFLLRVDNVQKVLGEGTAKELRYTKREIVQMGFSSKPYDIPAINKTAIDQFPFSALYYYKPTLDDLKAFYKDYCLHAANDDIDVASIATVAATKVEKPAAKAEKPASKVTAEAKSTPPPKNDLPEDTIDDLDNVAASPSAPSVNSTPVDNTDKIDIDDLLNDIGL